MLRPGDALRAAFRLLKDDGVVVMTTPNIGGLFPRITYRVLGQTIGAWEHPTPPHHLYQFSRKTLGALLTKAGFEVVSWKTRPMGLKYTVKQMEDAIVEALKDRLGALPLPSSVQLACSPCGPETSGPFVVGASHSRSRGSASKRLLRRTVAGFCWSFSLPLYLVPVAWFGVGDSMLVVARKRHV
jgi:hypothetical protein